MLILNPLFWECPHPWAIVVPNPALIQNVSPLGREPTDQKMKQNFIVFSCDRVGLLKRKFFNGLVGDTTVMHNVTRLGGENSQFQHNRASNA